MTAWTVTVQPHHVIGPALCYLLPARVTTVGGEDARAARMQACRDLHVRFGLPSWRPYLRQSWPHVTVERMESHLERVARGRR